ncbi:hypothetical protein MHU86_18234 [Fragilaria crotonensis]|nr:hypothetical protein MHU86_18234 [Fragilaria crotonensis]
MAKTRRSNAVKTSRRKGERDTRTDDDASLEDLVLSSKTKDVSWIFTNPTTTCVVVLSVFALYLKDRIPAKSFSLTTSDVMSQCGLVMANSTLPDSGWGMFPLRPIPSGNPVSFGDPILQVPDISRQQGHRIAYLLHNYMWSGDVTGGIHEGHVVYSVLPGVGSLANGHPVEWNMVMGATQIDEAGVRRTESPGAGAFTQYHNFSFYSHRDLSAGQELMVNYGHGWNDKIPHHSLGESSKRPVEWLRSNGICLDHIQPALSEIPHAGRGAVSTRFLPKNTVVAPLPLLPIQSRAALKRKVGGWQLLLNYCFSHPQSSLLFVPYSPVVNLVNHASRDRANVRLQWSTSNLFHGKHLLKSTNIFEVNPSGLLLELVATRDIQQGQEILLDYGDAWQASWDQHVNDFVPPADDYEYARIADEDIKVLRTPSELVDNPYPSNIRTTCFYKFRETHQKSPVAWTSPEYVFQNLYPCRVLDRHENDIYTVVIGKSESALNKNKIPVNHVVTNVPRHAIRLDDKRQSSDQNLVSAFRHEIHIPDEIFPVAWKDLA